MQNCNSGALDFPEALRDETDCVLADPLFLRSPIQSKLLRFLCDRANNGDYNLTQHEIAVDGLGKSEDYDLQNDSYPRVQVSRLRSNLTNYYSRHEPSKESCIYIKQGDYRLRLGPRKTAYPSAFESVSAKPETDSGSTVDDASLGPAATPPKNPVRSKKNRLAVLGILFALVLVGLSIVRPFTSDGSKLPPAVALNIKRDTQFGGTGSLNYLHEKVERVARRQLKNSFVSNLVAGQAAESNNVGYIVMIDLGAGIDATEASISLQSSLGETLFVTTIPFDGDESDFLRKISSSLVYMVSPNGIIATRELSQMHGTPQSPYQCFINIEGNRARGKVMDEMLDSCIERFPRDQFAPFWYARKAFVAYQVEISVGKNVPRNTPAWEYITLALDIDEYNAFANFVAAKVSFAEGSCELSRTFIARALERGSSYPAMVAAAEAEASGCSAESQGVVERQRDEIESLVLQNPAPDPLLHLYMMIAALSIEDERLARDVAGRFAVRDTSSEVKRASVMLRRAIEEPNYFNENEKEVRAMIALMVWNQKAREKIFAQLKAF